MEIIINGEPKAQKRHRYRRASRRIISYDPSKKDKQALAKQLAASMTSPPLEEDVHLMVAFYMRRPKSHYRSGKFSNELKEDSPKLHKSRPDIDNLLKLVMDAATGVLWKDDALVSWILTKKEYSSKPRIELEAWDPKKD